MSLWLQYFRSTRIVWLCLFVAIIVSLMCEFKEMRIPFWMADVDAETIDSINEIIKNISFSYIAGSIFFFLSDSIPFIRRKKVVLKQVNSSLTHLKHELNTLERIVSAKKWEIKDINMIFEDITGYEYQEGNDISYDIKKHFLKELQDFINLVYNVFDYILSQELYLDNRLLTEVSRLKNDKNFLLLRSVELLENPNIKQQVIIDLIKSLISLHSL